MKFIYPAVFRKKEDGGYDAHFPDLECCEASGETLDDAIDNANEAARTWITVELEEEDPIFPHVSDLEDIELAEDEIVRNLGRQRHLDGRRQTIRLQTDSADCSIYFNYGRGMAVGDFSAPLRSK